MSMWSKYAIIASIILVGWLFRAEEMSRLLRSNCEYLHTSHLLIDATSPGLFACSRRPGHPLPGTTPRPLPEMLRLGQQGNRVCEHKNDLLALSEQEKEPDRKFLIASLLGRCGYTERAVQLWREVGADQYFNQLGEAHLKAGELDQALEAYSTAVRISPDQGHWWLQRASTHLMIGNYDAALEDAERAVALDPLLEKAYEVGGVSMRRAGKLELAEQWFLRGHEQFPERPMPLVYLGGFYLFNRGDTDKAEHYIKEGLELAPDHVILNWQAAHLHQAKGNSKQAIAHLERATAGWRALPPEQLTENQRNSFLAYASTLARWYHQAGMQEATRREVCLVLTLAPPAELRQEVLALLDGARESCTTR